MPRINIDLNEKSNVQRNTESYMHTLDKESLLGIMMLPPF